MWECDLKHSLASIMTKLKIHLKRRRTKR
jgi:hypothetical protein